MKSEDTSSAGEEIKPKNGLWKVIKEGRPGLVAISLLIASARAVLTAFVIADIAYTIAQLANPKDHQDLSRFYRLIAMIGGDFVLRLVGTYVTAIASWESVLWIRREFLASAFRQEVAFYDEHSPQSLASTFASDPAQIKAGINVMNTLTQSACTVVVCLIFAFKAAPMTSLVILGACILPMVATAGLCVRYKRISKTDYFKDPNASAAELFTSIETVKSLNAHNTLFARIADLETEALTHEIHKAILIGIAMACFMTLPSIAKLGGYFYAAKSQEVTLENALNAVEQIIIVLTSIGYMANLLPNIIDAMSAAERMMAVIDRDPKMKLSIPTDRPIQGSVRFERVSFSYQSRPEVQVLNDFSLKVPVGSTVALVGLSGCGKSTIIRLMERFYDPIMGSITIGDTPISAFPLEPYHDAVRLVGQEPVLFNMTIAENILVGLNSKASVEEAMELIENAARRAHAHEFISEFPNGYDQMVGEKGARLSGGQKQRVAIARALIANPQVLLLDEATSALDTESEQAVQKSLDEIFASRECTAIVVAHRLSTIANADKIVVMDGGKIVEMGTHQELIDIGGMYASMVEKQKLE